VCPAFCRAEGNAAEESLLEVPGLNIVGKRKLCTIVVDIARDDSNYAKFKHCACGRMYS
jgi:hypothetical protein